MSETGLLAASAMDGLAAAHACLQKGDIDAATQLIVARLQSHPRDSAALHLMGAIELSSGHFDDASHHFQQAMGCTKDRHIQALCWNSLGHALTGLKDSKHAQEALRRAMLMDPAVLNYAEDLADALMSTQQPLLAIEILRTAVRQHPQSAEACVRLGNLLIQSSRFEEAMELFNEALKRIPDYPTAYFNASVALAILGQTERALTACARALQLDPQLNAYYQLASLGGLDHDQEHIAFAEQRATAADEIPLASQIDACFALARVYDHACDYARAFEHLYRGNRLKRATLEFNLQTETDRIDSITTFFSAGFMHRFTGKVQSNLKPIFIVGMPRCGSTLLEQILAAHPDITACGELDYMTTVAMETGANWGARGPASPGSDNEVISDLRGAAEKYRLSIQRCFDCHGPFTDKMLGNYLFVGLIHLLFPFASIIHIRRNPLDTCLSCYEHLFTGHIPYTYELTELGHYYRLYTKLMQHWRAVLPEKRILDLDYEALVENPEHEIRKALAYCGLPFDARCLQHDSIQRPVNTASANQVRRPVYRSSVGRWRNYAEYLKPLREALNGTL